MEEKAVFFKWTDQMSVKVEEIDLQHKMLIDLLNEMYQAFMNKEHKDKVGDVINRMVSYASFHFETEEKYFNQTKFEGSVSHIAEHQNFRDKVNEFVQKYQKNNGALTYEVMTFLRNWLTNHIMFTDRLYIDCFTNNGLK